MDQGLGAASEVPRADALSLRIALASLLLDQSDCMFGGRLPTVASVGYLHKGPAEHSVRDRGGGKEVGTPCCQAIVLL